MPIFYPGPEVRITHEDFVILGRRPARLKINELEDIHIVQEMNGARALLGLRRFELRAVYRGLVVRLYVSSDPLRFGQVRRALVRAVEAAG